MQIWQLSTQAQCADRTHSTSWAYPYCCGPSGRHAGLSALSGHPLGLQAPAAQAAIAQPYPPKLPRSFSAAVLSAAPILRVSCPPWGPPPRRSSPCARACGGRWRCAPHQGAVPQQRRKPRRNQQLKEPTKQLSV